MSLCQGNPGRGLPEASCHLVAAARYSLVGPERQKKRPSTKRGAASAGWRVELVSGEPPPGRHPGDSFDHAEPLVFERVVRALAHFDHPAHAARRRELLGAVTWAGVGHERPPGPTQARHAFGRQSTGPPTARPMAARRANPSCRQLKRRNRATSRADRAWPPVAGGA